MFIFFLSNFYWFSCVFSPFLLVFLEQSALCARHRLKTWYTLMCWEYTNNNPNPTPISSGILWSCFFYYYFSVGFFKMNMLNVSCLTMCSMCVRLADFSIQFMNNWRAMFTVTSNEFVRTTDVLFHLLSIADKRQINNYVFDLPRSREDRMKTQTAEKISE